MTPEQHAFDRVVTRMRKFTLIQLFAIVTAVACTCAYVTRPPNHASRHVNIDPDRERSIPRQQQALFQNASDRRVFIQTQERLLKSPFVLRAALRNASIYSKIRDILERKIEKNTNPVLWLVENLQVETVSGQMVAEISLTSYELSRDELQLILNSVCDAYDSETLQRERSFSASREVSSKSTRLAAAH